MISVGIIGGTGYTGKVLIEYLNNHPFVYETEVYANSSAGKCLDEVFPELQRKIKNTMVKAASAISLEHDLYFVALHAGEALNFIPRLISNGKLVVDLGGDFRLDYEELYMQWYNFTHTSAYLLREKVYGLADYPNTNYTNSKLIANPGCYPTAILLSLLPLLPQLSEKIISVSSAAYSGTTGAGKSARTDLLISEMYGNVKAYNVDGHRHEPEILQQLYKNGFHSPFSFTPHLLPAARGIYNTTTVHLTREFEKEEIIRLYDNCYKNSCFIRLRNTPPELKWVVDSNYCDINVSVSGKTLIITSAIDNLVKGASGQAIQNMNKMLGWDETTGLLRKEFNIVPVHS